MEVLSSAHLTRRGDAVESSEMKNLPWRSFAVGLLLAGAIGYALLARLERAAVPGGAAPAATVSGETTATPAGSPAPVQAPSAATMPAAGDATAQPSSNPQPLAPSATL